MRPLGVLLVFKEIAVAEALFHRGHDVVGRKPVAQLRDEHDIGLAGARQIQDSEGSSLCSAEKNSSAPLL